MHSLYRDTTEVLRNCPKSPRLTVPKRSSEKWTILIIIINVIENYLSFSYYFSLIIAVHPSLPSEVMMNRTFSSKIYFVLFLFLFCFVLFFQRLIAVTDFDQIRLILNLIFQSTGVVIFRMVVNVFTFLKKAVFSTFYTYTVSIKGMKLSVPCIMKTKLGLVCTVIL